MTATLRQKLEAMAERGTPPEREIARAKLEAMGPPPPRRPTAVAAPGFGSDYSGMWSSGTNSNGTYTWASFEWRTTW